MTVLGAIMPEDLGITLVHEHLLFDFLGWLQPPRAGMEQIIHQKIDLRNLDLFRRHSYVFRDNLVFSDPEVSAREISHFKHLGGKTIVDQTVRGAGTNPLALKAISQKTGLNIITGCGFYVRVPEAETKTVDELASIMIKDIREGIDNTGVKAGIIGEIGCLGDGKGSITPVDEKKIIAAAKAHNETKAPISIHPPLPQRKEIPRIIQLLENENVNLKKVAMSHMDKPDALTHGKMDLHYIQRIASYGVYIAFDGFGMDWPWSYEDFGFLTPTDYERVLALKELIEGGYLDQLLVSHDVGVKHHLQEYGGHGYDHLLKNIVPIMKREGIEEESVQALLRENPKRFLSA